MHSHQKIGFSYVIETIVGGLVVDAEEVHNLMPMEGLNHTLGVLLNNGVQASSWYIGIYEGNYTPTGSETAASIASAATETTAYAETTRVAFVGAAPLAGTMSNAASRAEFTLNADKTIYGGYMISSAAKGAVSGVLLSLVRFSSPKVLQAGSILRVTAGVTFASA